MQRVFPAWALSGPLPHQEGLAAEALQAVEPAEEADTLLVAIHAVKEVQGAWAMDCETDLSGIKEGACKDCLPVSYCASVESVQEQEVHSD